MNNIEYITKEKLIQILNTNKILNDIIKDQNINYQFGVIFFTNIKNQLKIHNIVGYKKIPNQLNIKNTISELSNNINNKLDKEIINNIQYIIINFNDIKEIKN
jgi:hypothetical protein